MAIEERMLLALPTIEDRAKYIFDNIEKKGVNECLVNNAWQFSEYGELYAIEGAMKIQDRIARQEERERCIKAALKYCCNHCAMKNSKVCRICEHNYGIRKAIEEGGKE